MKNGISPNDKVTRWMDRALTHMGKEVMEHEFRLLWMMLCTEGSHFLIFHIPLVTRTSFLCFYSRIYLPSYSSSLGYDWKDSHGQLSEWAL